MVALATLTASFSRIYGIWAQTSVGLAGPAAAAVPGDWLESAVVPSNDSSMVR